MAYFTKDQLKSRIDNATLILLTNDDPAGTTIDENKLDEIISTAYSIIDSALRGRYALPLTITDGDLKDIGITIARYKLYELRQAVSMPESLIAGWSQAMQRLRQYQTGERVLDVGNAVDAHPTFIKTVTKAKKFTTELMELYNS
ncbi:MAG: DUF1320 domain-containing protein [Bacteroidetes bacterium]|nr:DUF1320 domain-containing protein [Bacteroidota bacterium]